MAAFFAAGFFAGAFFATAFFAQPQDLQAQAFLATAFFAAGALAFTRRKTEKSAGALRRGVMYETNFFEGNIPSASMKSSGIGLASTATFERGAEP